jgi:hypothetical protein
VKAGPFRPYFNVMEASVARMSGRRIAEQVVPAVRIGDAIECVRKRIGIHGREATGALRNGAQTVLREAHFAEQGLRPTERRAHRSRWIRAHRVWRT